MVRRPCGARRPPLPTVAPQRTPWISGRGCRQAAAWGRWWILAAFMSRAWRICRRKRSSAPVLRPHPRYVCVGNLTWSTSPPTPPPPSPCLLSRSWCVVWLCFAGWCCVAAQAGGYAEQFQRRKQREQQRQQQSQQQADVPVPSELQGGQPVTQSQGSQGTVARSLDRLNLTVQEVESDDHPSSALPRGSGRASSSSSSGDDVDIVTGSGYEMLLCVVGMRKLTRVVLTVLTEATIRHWHALRW